MASRLQDVILRGLASAKPLATTVAQGTLYYSTDTGTTDRSNGTIWETYADLTVGGVPGAHATTHSSAGSDAVDVKNLGGYPGGTTTFLRADHTFATPAVPSRTGVIEYVIDGGGSVITTGAKQPIEIPFACTIQTVTLLADVSGSIVIDIWKDTYTNYPPTVADTIVASLPPTITTALKSQNSTLTGWNTAITAGDILLFSVNSVTTITKVTISLKVSIP